MHAATFLGCFTPSTPSTHGDDMGAKWRISNLPIPRDASRQLRSTLRHYSSEVIHRSSWCYGDIRLCTIPTLSKDKNRCTGLSWGPAYAARAISVATKCGQEREECRKRDTSKWWSQKCPEKWRFLFQQALLTMIITATSQNWMERRGNNLLPMFLWVQLKQPSKILLLHYSTMQFISMIDPHFARERANAYCRVNGAEGTMPERILKGKNWPTGTNDQHCNCFPNQLRQVYVTLLEVRSRYIPGLKNIKMAVVTLPIVVPILVARLSEMRRPKDAQYGSINAFIDSKYITILSSSSIVSLLKRFTFDIALFARAHL